MTIHTEHPFRDPDEDRRPVRRLRGRLTSPVTVWAARHAGTRAGLTVSSVLVADGDPGRLIGLLDEESELWPVLAAERRAAVTLLGPDDRQLADVFAGVAPSPGGPFRTGRWVDSDWGPVLPDHAWAGAVLVGDARAVGWSLLVELEVQHVELGGGDAVGGGLAYRRGRYLPVSDG